MGRCKALIDWGEETLIEHVIGCYRAVQCFPIVVVVGGTHEQAIREQLTSLDDVLVVQNSNPSLGMLSSIQRGLEEAVQAGADSVMFGPVDVPFQTSDGTKYPANWLRLTTLDEKKAIGIKEVKD